MKEYKFIYSTYYTSNGCSCCESEEWEVYNSESIPHSCTSVADCYISAIDDALRERDTPLEVLEELCTRLNIRVVIEEEGL